MVILFVCRQVLFGCFHHNSLMIIGEVSSLIVVILTG